MMTSFYNLLKYAATGIASPDMTYFDKMRASTLMGGVVQTLTGQPPLSFKADGTPLISWSMKGNGSQSGTPTPDNPILPEFVGTGTNTNVVGNFSTLLTSTISDSYSTISDVWVTYNGSGLTYYMACGGNEKYYVHLPADYTGLVRIYTANTTQIPTPGNSVKVDRIARDAESQVDYVFTTPSDAKKIIIQFSTTSSDYIMANATFDRGYKITISCGEEITTVYLGEVPTVRRVKKLVLDGTENWDSASQSSTRNNYFRIKNFTTAFSGKVFCTHYVSPDENISINNTIEGCKIQTSTEFAILLIIRPPEWQTWSIDYFKSYLAAQYAAGTPVTIWYVLANEQTGIVNEPLCKIGDYADELHSEDAAATIPTAKGQNSLTVDTDLQPSEMTITYRG